MGFNLFGGSSKKAEKYRKQAQAKMQQATDLYNLQTEIDFQRALLSNIRQERMARSQLDLINYSDDFTSSSASGAKSMVQSGLASATGYSLNTSKRVQQIQDLQTDAQKLYEKYQEKLQSSSSTLGTIGAIGGAIVGGMVAGPAGAAAGMSIGQGAAQIFSGTGQTSAGINNIISGATSYYTGIKQEDYNKQVLDMYKNYMNLAYPTKGSQYTVSSINSSGQMFNTQTGPLQVLLGSTK